MGMVFGCYRLDRYDQDPEKRHSPECGRWVSNVLRITGASRWEQITGRNIRVLLEGQTLLSAKALAIGHLIEEDWFFPAGQDKPQENT